jgi:hypothetical protein
MPDEEALRALVAQLGGDGQGRGREQLVEELVRLRHEQILDTELRILAGIRDDPPDGPPVPVPGPRPAPTILADVGRETVQDLPKPRRRRAIGRISRLLWRALKPSGGRHVRAWRVLITVTEPLGAALIRFGLRRFVE